MKPNIWAIEKRLSFEELASKLDKYNDLYAGRLVILRKNGDHYRISHFSTLNENGKAEFAVNYHPYSPSQERDYHKIRHTRPAREFFDGRFSY